MLRIDAHLDPVAELRARFHAEEVGCRLVGEVSETHDDAEIGEQGELAIEERPARISLVGQRRVCRRGTLHCRRHPRTAQFESVPAVRGSRLVGEPRLVHRAVEPVPAAVSGEHPTRAIRAVRRRGEAENQETRRRVAETRHAATPIVVVPESGALFEGDTLAPLDETRTCRALVNIRRKARKRILFSRAHVHRVGAQQVFSEPMARAAKPKHPSATTVLLVRHGQTPTTGQSLPGRAKGLHLSDKGREQAAEVAERLAAFPKIDAIYASPLERTRETAAPLAKKLRQRVVIDKGLIECDFGDWTGAKLADLMKKPEWATVQRAPSTFRFPSGESFTEMQVRITTALDSIRLRHPGGVVVCFSHADPIKAALAHAMGTHLDLFQRIVVSTCSVSALAYGTGSPIVLTVNSTGGSLADLRPS